jgi:type II secretory pathway component PulM
VLATIGGLLLCVAIVIGGWQLGWWLKDETVNRNAQILQDSYGRQNALVEQVLDDIREVEAGNLPPQQVIAITAQICDSTAKLTGTIQLPQSAVAFTARNC